MIETERECSQCGEVKPLEEGFYKSKVGRSGYHAECKECKKSRDRDIYRRRKSQTPDAHRRSRRNSQLKHLYGITVEDYETMLEEQGGVCAICEATDVKGRHGVHFHVDHDHKTGKVRGLLCHECNTALGKFQDSPEILRSAINYLEVTR